MFHRVFYIIVTIFLAHAHKKHECIHDSIDHNITKAINIPYFNHPYDKSLTSDLRRRVSLRMNIINDNLRVIISFIICHMSQTCVLKIFCMFVNDIIPQLALNDESYDHIRITPYYGAIESVLSGDDLSFVKSLISASIRYLESFVKVIPIDGTFYLPRQCSSYYLTNGYINCASYRSVCGASMFSQINQTQNMLHVFFDNILARSIFFCVICNIVCVSTHITSRHRNSNYT